MGADKSNKNIHLRAKKKKVLLFSHILGKKIEID